MIMYKRFIQMGIIFLGLYLLIIFTKGQEAASDYSGIVGKEEIEDEIQEEGELNKAEREAIFKQILETDYTFREYPIDEKRYTEPLDRIYKEAFLKVLTNQVPISKGYGYAKYFRDHFRGIYELNNEEFIRSFLKHCKYYYLDKDGDGLPELVIDTGYDGLCFLKYDSEKMGSVRTSTTMAGTVFLGAQQTYSWISGAGATYYEYRGSEDEVIDFWILYGDSG